MSPLSQKFWDALQEREGAISNKFWTILFNFEVFLTISNHFLCLSQSISFFLGLYWSISVDLGLYWSISVYLCLPLFILVYLFPLYVTFFFKATLRSIPWTHFWATRILRPYRPQKFLPLWDASLYCSCCCSLFLARATVGTSLFVSLRQSVSQPVS